MPMNNLGSTLAIANPAAHSGRGAVGAEHEDMLARSDGYMTAWLLWQLCDDGDAAPERLVDAGRGVLDELEGVGGAARARAAHAAARADGEGAGGVLLDRAEGAERLGGGLVGDLLVVDDDSAHRRNFLSSRRSASASACAVASPSSIVRSARASGGKMRFTCVGEPLRP